MSHIPAVGESSDSSTKAIVYSPPPTNFHPPTHLWPPPTGVAQMSSTTSSLLRLEDERAVLEAQLAAAQHAHHDSLTQREFEVKREEAM